MPAVIPFDVWAANASGSLTRDVVWKLPAYRLACYALHLAWTDVSTLARRGVTEPIGAQLYRAIGSIGANISEGYSRSSGRDRVRIYEYALGSARESIVWYTAAEPILGGTIVEHRRTTLQEICRLLLAVIPQERSRLIAKSPTAV
jgi:four helix bundle protein